jgi:hypothetical protein
MLKISKKSAIATATAFAVAASMTCVPLAMASENGGAAGSDETTKTVGLITYKANKDGKTAKVIGYKKAAIKKVKTLTINTVTIGGKKLKVTSIEKKALKGLKALTKVTIGSNVKEIKAWAFKDCTKLKTVKGGKGLTKIGKSAFAKSKKLSKFTISSKKLKTIGAKAFKSCKKLKKLSLAKTTKLTKKGVKNCLKSSKVKTVKVKKAKKKAYKKLFTKKVAGKKATVK